jgi:hypothetical protein
MSIHIAKGISMSAPHYKHKSQCRLQASSIKATVYQHRETSIAGYALLLGVTAIVPMALIGCQSSPNTSAATGTSTAIIDFNIADTAQSQAQSKAFTARLTADAQRYQQLFDQANYPNNENQAKLQLLTAIRQHLATEHVAVAKANYQVSPFINPDSIDADSSSLLRTVLELYAYRENRLSNHQDELSEAVAALDATTALDDTEFNNLDDGYNPAAAAIEAAFASTYNEGGYDQDGYDYYGFDRDGFDSNGYNQEGFDEDGYDQNGYNKYANQREDEDYSSVRASLLSGISALNPQEILSDYEAMQSAKQAANDHKSNQSNDKSVAAYTSVIGQILGRLHKTPEQIAAANIYQYQPLAFSGISQYQPEQRQLQSIYSYDYASPTINLSIQIPLAFDFNNSSITLDPSAIMPIIALANPEYTPLPSQMTSHTVNFGLPESITSQLPSAVIYDAAIAAVQDSLAELAPEYFTAVDIRDDTFAKEVGAIRAVKVYFGSKQSGEIIGKMFKHMSQYLNNYVDNNPDKYPDSAKLKIGIDKLQLYNKGYQSTDVGALLQLIEAVIPISFNQVNYYYLDSSNRLIAKEQRLNIGGDLMGSNTKMVNQIRYDDTSFKQHALAPLFSQSFAAATPAIDGNAWLQEQRQQQQRLRAARYVRYAYDDSNDNGNDDNYNYEDSDYIHNEDDYAGAND